MDPSQGQKGERTTEKVIQIGREYMCFVQRAFHFTANQLSYLMAALRTSALMEGLSCSVLTCDRRTFAGSWIRSTEEPEGTAHRQTDTSQCE